MRTLYSIEKVIHGMVYTYIPLVGQECAAVAGLVDQSPLVDCYSNPNDAGVTAGNSLSGASTIRLYGIKANAICSDTLEVTFFGEISSVGQLVGEPFVEAWDGQYPIVTPVFGPVKVEPRYR